MNNDSYQKILDFPFVQLDQEKLTSLMYTSLASAKEFRDALLLTLAEFPDDEKLKELKAGELQTDNLQFEDYNRAGDHYEFLEHFLKGIGIPEKARKACEEYTATCNSFSKELRIASLISREEKLQGIFKKVLQAEGFKNNPPPHLAAFKYYLERHIELDGQEGGHNDLSKHVHMNIDVEPFYKTRLKMYQVLL